MRDYSAKSYQTLSGKILSYQCFVVKKFAYLPDDIRILCACVWSLTHFSYLTLTHSCLRIYLTSIVWTKPHDYFSDISLTKAIVRKYLEESCSSELNPQLSFKFFANLFSILKFFQKYGRSRRPIAAKTD